MTDTIVRSPVTSVACPSCKKGVLFKILLSRLETGLGHEGFRCDKCARTVRFVPPSSANAPTPPIPICADFQYGNLPAVPD